MIKELTNFVNGLPPVVFSYNLQLEEGLYFEIDFDDEGNLILLNKEAHGIKLKKEETEEHEQTKPKKKDRQEGKPKELSAFLIRCLKLQSVTKHEFQVNKCFNSTEKIFIQTASPFALGFKKEAIEGKIITDRPKLQKAVESYFKRASDFVKSEYQQHRDWLEKFQNFCTGGMLDWIRSQDIYERAPDKAVIRIFYAAPSFEDFKIVYDAYLNANALFDADPETEMGVSELMSKFTNQKVFMAHKSAPFEVNFQVPTNVAKTIWQFFQLRKRALPNPLPVFIDKKELNGEMVAIMNEDRSISYSQMLKRLFEDVPKGDLGSYYLLFFVKGSIADLDFVPAFRYHLDGMQITEVIPLGGKMAGKIDNVFEFERRIANKIFDGQLIMESKKWLKYFDSIEYDPNYISHNTYNQLLKYRKGFYDYIYKSKQEAIHHHAFQDIMSRSILDFIHRDAGKDSKNDNEYAIKEKLNIWFSLYDYFNSSKSNQSDMINKTQNMAARMQEVVKEGGEEAFRSEDEFAFASGQLIRFLLSKSESGNRSHALLEPFLQKTEPGLFKLAIARAFDTYKHAFKFYGGSKRYEFDKIMSLVMGYEPKPDTNMKEHLPLILAGYFSKTVFYSDSPANKSATNV